MKRKALGFVLGILALLGLGALPAFSATPYNGTWAGTNSAGRPVSFTTSADGTSWSAFSYGIQFECPYVGTVTTTITQSGPGAITDGAFSYSSSTLAFTGTFDSPASASGTYTLTSYPVTHGLPGPPYVHTDYITHSGTWTASFTGMSPTITVTAPDGGESWTAGTSHDITWTSTGTFANARLEYSINGGSSWTLIVESTSNSGAYSWTVPAPGSSSCLVRASGTAYPGVSDASNAVFTIAVAATPDRQALIALYNATNGDGWYDNSGWKTPPLDSDGFAMPGTEGGWHGITLDSGTLAVTKIYLNDNNLAGSLPAELGNLASLQELNLSTNPITGSLPASLGNLSSLGLLAIRDCQLTGSIPPEFGNMTSLWDLFLGFNHLSGSIPPELGSIATLTQIYLMSNDLTGPIPPELGNLANLEYLQLQENQLTGTIPSQLANLTSLGDLELHTNQLTGEIPAGIWSLANLHIFRVQSNQLTGTIPAEVGSGYTEIVLSNNQLSGPIPDAFGTLNLYYLELHNNQFSGPIPASLGNCTNLHRLTLDNNHLTGSVPASFGSLVNLSELRLGNNQLSGGIPSELGNLTGLYSLSLNGNQLVGAIPASLVNLTSLSDYFTDFGYNSLYASDPSLIAFLNSKDGDWAATQTIAPSSATATSLDNAVILVSWLPIAYTGDTGCYKVMISQTQGGPYSLAGQTADKSTSALEIGGLTPGQLYYFVVQTHTDAHANNQSALESENSNEASAMAWLHLNVAISGTVTVDGAPLAGVAMNGLTGSPVTNASGVYVGTEAAGWSGTVTPALEGYAFAPGSRTYTSVTEDQTAQDYAATAIVTGSITVLSPNGGESWQAGSTQAVTWTQTGLTGTATIDLYKGGVYQLTLGTADVTAGTFSWQIASGQTAGTDYRVLVWQGAVSDDSNADFEITAFHAQEDFVATWDGQGVYYRNSDTGAWVRMASPAMMVATGDLDGDGISDVIGLWPGQGGIWVKYSKTGAWAKLSSTAVHIAAGDMNGDGRVDLVGTWDGQGVFYRNSLTGAWVKMASPATMVTTGDIDGDGTDDLVGIWPSQGGVWVKFSQSGLWARLSSTARDISAGDADGDGRDDLVATWDGQGVFYRNSVTGAWVMMASPADQVTCGDLDADGKHDLVGIWPSQGGVWAKFSDTNTWARLSSTARDISAGVMRAQGAGAAAEAAIAAAESPAALELSMPVGGAAEGPESAVKSADLSADGPGGARFVFLEEKNLVPMEDKQAALTRVPGPGEPQFVPRTLPNRIPGEALRKEANRKKAK
ncbi:MAG: hypothetical protein ABFD52_06160 [Acidobacteriota bacterium]